jgi:UDP-N-acetylmuramate dehydrogenase
MLQILHLHPLKSYTTLNIGGLARFFCVVKTQEDYLEALDLATQKSLPIFVLGKGSNVLFIDEVFEAVVVLNRINHLSLALPEVICGSGYYISLLSSKVSRQGYKGLEGASGIPATVGGAVFMNAGAGNFETCQSMSWVKSIDHTGQLIFREKKQVPYAYRTSVFQQLDEFILEVCFHLESSDDAWDLQQTIIKKRIKTQPYKECSAGCFFKNPPGTSAGLLIDQAGLKGFEFKGSKVSSLHANFLVNHHEAKASDFLQMATFIERKVFELTGIVLEREVKLVGNFIYAKI